MRTDPVTLPGFSHDVMAATFVLFMTSPAGAALGPHPARHGMEYCHTAHPTAVLRPDGSAGSDHGSGKNIAAFNALAAGDGTQHAADVGGILAVRRSCSRFWEDRCGPGPRQSFCSGKCAKRACAALRPGWVRR